MIIPHINAKMAGLKDFMDSILLIFNALLLEHAAIPRI